MSTELEPNRNGENNYGGNSCNDNGYGADTYNYNGNYDNSRDTYDQYGYNRFTETWTDALQNSEILSDRQYNIAIGVLLLWGFFINFILVKTVNVSFFLNDSSHLTIFYIAYFVLAIAGAIMCSKSQNLKVVLAGYNMLVVPLGVALAIIVAGTGYDTEIVGRAVLITGLVTIGMLAASTAFPDVFNTVGRFLGMALGITIIVELAVSLFTGSSLVGADVIVSLLFCIYIGYDWGNAQNREKTYASAVSSAAELYLDIINLLIRIIRIMAKSKSKR